MIYLDIYKKGFALFFILLTSVYSLTLDEMIASKDIDLISDTLKKIKVVYSENDFPNNPKNNDLAIIEDDYNVQIVFEYKDGVWNERTDEVLAHILNSNEKLGFSHLFGFKLDNREFQQYNSDKQNIFVEILKSKSTQKDLTNNINYFLTSKKIKSTNIINIEINIIDDKNSKIIIIYKY